MESDSVDWDAIAAIIETNDGPGRWKGGSHQARKAITHLLGDELLNAAVERNVYDGGAGGQAALDVLQFLRPTCALNRCCEIFDGSTDEEVRHWAARLLSAIDDGRNVERIELFLDDGSVGVRGAGGWMLHRLVLEGFVEPSDQINELIDLLESKGGDEMAEQLRNFIAELDSE